VIVIAILIGGAAGLVVNFFQPKMYEATTTLYVSAPDHSDYPSVLGAQQAAKALASFPQSDEVLKATLHTVSSLSLSLPQLSSMITVTNTIDTQFVIIKLRDRDPKRAAQLASEIAKQSIVQFTASQTNNIQTKQFIEREMAGLETEITKLEQQLVEIIQRYPYPSIQEPAVNELSTRLNTEVSNDRTLYNQLLASDSSISSFQVTIIQQAGIPKDPVGLGAKVIVAMGMLAALVVIACVILFIEQNNRIPVVRPDDSIAVLDQKTGLTTVIKVKDLTIIAKPETGSEEPTEKLPKVVMPKQAGAQTKPETPRDNVAFNSHKGQDKNAEATKFLEP